VSARVERGSDATLSFERKEFIAGAAHQVVGEMQAVETVARFRRDGIRLQARHLGSA